MQMMEQAVAHQQICLKSRGREGQWLLLIAQALRLHTSLTTPGLRHGKHALRSVQPQHRTICPALGQAQTDVARTTTEIHQTSLRAKLRTSQRKQLLNSIHHGLIGNAEVSRRMGIHLQRVVHDLRLKHTWNHQIVGLDCNSSVCVG